MFYTKIEKKMGNRFVISIDDESEKAAFEKIDLAFEEITRIEKLFTTFSEESITQKINKNAGIQAVSVPYEFFDLVERAQKISELTQGAFDLSYGSIDISLWNFDQNMKNLPLEKVSENLELIDYRNIILDSENTSIFLKNKGMRIGFGGIVKGYAADQAAFLLQKLGIKNGIVNASGDLKTWGTQNNKPWTIAVANPDAPKTAFSTLEISNLAVATSGNYEKFITIDGKKYSHTINPKTGLPISGIKSVTVICPIAELADALATPLSILGISASLDLINQMKNIACVIIDDNNRIFTSKNLMQ